MAPGVVAGNGRLPDVHKMIKDFGKMTKADRGEVDVTVTTAAVRCARPTPALLPCRASAGGGGGGGRPRAVSDL